MNEHEEGQYRCGSQKYIQKRIESKSKSNLGNYCICDDMSVCVFFLVVHVHWALRARLAKSTLMTAKTTTVRTGQPASMESTTTLAFVPPTTQVV